MMSQNPYRSWAKIFNQLWNLAMCTPLQRKTTGVTISSTIIIRKPTKLAGIAAADQTQASLVQHLVGSLIKMLLVNRAVHMIINVHTVVHMHIQS